VQSDPFCSSLFFTGAITEHSYNTQVGIRSKLLLDEYISIRSIEIKLDLDLVYQIKN
jgi:hypothetical protein